MQLEPRRTVSMALELGGARAARARPRPARARPRAIHEHVGTSDYRGSRE